MGCIEHAKLGDVEWGLPPVGCIEHVKLGDVEWGLPPVGCIEHAKLQDKIWECKGTDKDFKMHQYNN